MSQNCYDSVLQFTNVRGLTYHVLLMLAYKADKKGVGRFVYPHLWKKIVAGWARISVEELEPIIVELTEIGFFVLHYDDTCYHLHLPNMAVAATASVSEREGFIYVLKSKSGYKIGRTRNIEARMGSFNVQLPFPFKLIHSFPVDDMVAVERELHTMFADCRLNGEWFNLSPDQVEWLLAQKTW